MPPSSIFFTIKYSISYSFLVNPLYQLKYHFSTTLLWVFSMNICFSKYNPQWESHVWDHQNFFFFYVYSHILLYIFFCLFHLTNKHIRVEKVWDFWANLHMLQKEKRKKGPPEIFVMVKYPKSHVTCHECFILVKFVK